MPDDAAGSSKRVLDPIDRLSEILFGLIMVLTFTGSLNVAEGGREDIRTMLFGALGCNLAWGIIDGVFYLMGCMAERGKGLLTLRAVRSATDPEAAHRLIAEAVPPAVASILEPEDLERIRQRLKGLPEPPVRPRWHRDDWSGAGAVFALVFLSTFPVTIPFIFMQNVTRALRVSNVDRDRDAVPDRLRVWPLRGAPPVADGDRDGRPRIRPRGHDHRAGGMKPRVPAPPRLYTG